MKTIATTKDFLKNQGYKVINVEEAKQGPYLFIDAEKDGIITEFLFKREIAVRYDGIGTCISHPDIDKKYKLWMVAFIHSIIKSEKWMTK
jgi:hypothetical protein